METTAEPTAQETANLKPAWGLTPPPGVTAAWGARAIYTANREAYKANHTKTGAKRKRGLVPEFFVELLYDRQGAAGNAEDLEALSAWINKVGLPKLREMCSEQYVTPDSNDAVSFSQGRFEINASPRSSYGYLYIGAWVR